MGRLTLNVLLSFAQFERELIGERVRDKIAASKRKGLWVGGQIRSQQQRQRGWKLYSFHAPEVECIGKGKASAPYEFGVKASIVTTSL
jgi:transposase, IS5 family